MIVILLPIFIPIIIILRFTGEKKVLYFQERVGFKRKTFRIIKFATMLQDSPNIGAGAITLSNDPRVLPFGRFLRKTKINELPQLINILCGDMSLVGPRPLMLKQFTFYDEASQVIISKMRPGLTGIGSIIFRNEEKYFIKSENPDLIYQLKIAPAKAIVEKWYFQNKGTSLYFKLIFLTILAVFFPKLDFVKILDYHTKKELDSVLRKN